MVGRECLVRDEFYSDESRLINDKTQLVKDGVRQLGSYLFSF